MVCIFRVISILVDYVESAFNLIIIRTFIISYFCILWIIYTFTSSSLTVSLTSSLCTRQCIARCNAIISIFLIFRYYFRLTHWLSLHISFTSIQYSLYILNFLYQCRNTLYFAV